MNFFTFDLVIIKLSKCLLDKFTHRALLSNEKRGTISCIKLVCIIRLYHLRHVSLTCIIHMYHPHVSSTCIIDTYHSLVSLLTLLDNSWGKPLPGQQQHQ